MTTNGHSDVSLHPTYEGQFVISTSASSKIQVNVDEEVKDPSGKQRERQVKYTGSMKGFQTGEVFWGSKLDKTRDGVVTITTSKGPATLSL
jgi:hypothetical protein